MVRRMGLKRDLADLIRATRRLGWKVELTPGGHWRWTAPSGAFFFSAQTPSDFRVLKYVRSDIRKIETGRRHGGHDD